MPRPSAASALPDHPLAVGWKEWVSLPDLGLLAVRVKVDTGARTSALHAVDLEVFEDRGKQRVRFVVHPVGKNPHIAVHAEADVIDERTVISSNGHEEHRVVIQTTFRLGLSAAAPEWPIELTLTDRRRMRMRMLLGREAMKGRIVVHPGAEYLHGQIPSARPFYVKP
jgi:hypothetical protein